MYTVLSSPLHGLVQHIVKYTVLVELSRHFFCAVQTVNGPFPPPCPPSSCVKNTTSTMNVLYLLILSRLYLFFCFTSFYSLTVGLVVVADINRKDRRRCRRQDEEYFGRRHGTGPVRTGIEGPRVTGGGTQVRVPTNRVGTTWTGQAGGWRHGGSGRVTSRPIATYLL